MDVAADKDTDGGGKDVERGARKGFEAIRAGVSVTAAGFDPQPWGGELKVPCDAVLDGWVVIVVVPIPDAGLVNQ